MLYDATIKISGKVLTEYFNFLGEAVNGSHFFQKHISHFKLKDARSKVHFHFKSSNILDLFIFINIIVFTSTK